MNKELLRQLEMASARRRQAKVLSAGPLAPVGADVKVSTNEPTTMAVENKNPLLIAWSTISPLEAVVKAPPEGILI